MCKAAPRRNRGSAAVTRADAGVLGWPTVKVPAGVTDARLPVGAQLLGPANSEPLPISLASHLETEERWQDRRPPSA
jgi:amidase